MATILIKINDNDISDYLMPNAFDKIPFISRNRNWSPIAAGFDLNVSVAYPYNLAKEQLVEVLIDSNSCYLGYIRAIKKHYGNTDATEDHIISYTLSISNYLEKLQTKLLEYDELHQAIAATANFSTGYKTITSVNTSTDTLTSAGHGYSDGDRVELNGNLPGGLSEYTQYDIYNKTTDTFQLVEPYGNTPINLTTIGSSLKIALADATKYSTKDNEGYPHVTIEHLVQKIFSRVGITLNIDNVYNTDLFATTITPDSLFYDWGQLVFDENMLYCLNQSKAISHTAIDNDTNYDYYKNKLSLWEFISFLFTILGFTLKYTGNTTNKQYTLYAQTRNSNAVPVTTTEPKYSIANDNIYDYETDDLPGKDDGYEAEVLYAARANYDNGTIDDLDLKTLEHSGARENRIDILNNWRIFLRKLTDTPGDDELVSTSTYEFYLEQQIFNHVYEIEKDLFSETIQCAVQNSINTIRENSIMLSDGDTISHIIQEVFTT